VPLDGSAAPVTVRRWREGWTTWVVLDGGDILTTTENNRKYLRVPASGGEPGAPMPFTGEFVGANFNLQNERLADGSPLLRVLHYGPRGYLDGVGALDLRTGRTRLLIDDALRGVPLAPDRLLF